MTQAEATDRLLLTEALETYRAQLRASSADGPYREVADEDDGTVLYFALLMARCWLDDYDAA